MAAVDEKRREVVEVVDKEGRRHRVKPERNGTTFKADWACGKIKNGLTRILIRRNIRFQSRNMDERIQFSITCKN